MTVVRVNPESVRSYGTQAQGIFESMHSSLTALVNDVVAVRYFGPNSVSFKTECGRVATDFAAKLHADMAGMAHAVRTSTTNIAGALGGAPISVTLESRAITSPTPAVVDYVDVDTEALSNLTPVVTRHFDALREGLARHLAALQGTDWEGNAKTSAVGAVAGFTNSARAKCDAAQQSISGYITAQIDSVTSADV